ncbi:MAG: hypothetical protein ACLQBL_27640 [Polyangiaceae bacterium]
MRGGHGLREQRLLLGGKGGFCSLSCTSDAECPPGADGTQHCNPHGYCRY